MFSVNSNCVIYLSGYLNQMPGIENNDSCDIVIRVKRYCERERVTQNHRVIIQQQDAYRILKFGALGMSITIQGDLRERDQIEIVARYIEFDDFSRNTPQCSMRPVIH